MPTKEELIKKYSELSGADIWAMYSKKEEYTKEAYESILAVINERGGIEHLEIVVEEERKIEREKKRLGNNYYLQLKDGVRESVLKSKLQSDILSLEEMEILLAKSLEKVKEEREDVNINERTILGSFIGGIIGGTIAGTILAVQVIYAQKVVVVLLIVAAVIPYFLIKAFTKQSYQNIAVLIATGLSIGYAYVFAQIIIAIVGIKVR